MAICGKCYNILVYRYVYTIQFAMQYPYNTIRNAVSLMILLPSVVLMNASCIQSHILYDVIDHVQSVVSLQWISDRHHVAAVCVE